MRTAYTRQFDTGDEPMTLSPSIVIRQALPTDYFRIVEMWKSSMRATFGPFMAERALAPWAEGSLINQSVWAMMSRMLVASDRSGPGADVYGVISIRGQHIDLIWVGETSRGHGVGARLLEAAEAAIADDGHATFCLEVFEKNQRAIAFYERHGWTKYDVYFSRSNGARKVKMIKQA